MISRKSFPILGSMTVLANDLRIFRPIKILAVLWRHRELVLRLTLRDIEMRVRGSMLGVVWIALLPIYMLTLYTFAFGVVFHAHWTGPKGNGTLHVALLYFVGLIFNELLAECLNRGPVLMFENVSYIKKVVFPIETLAFVVAGSGLFRVCVSGVILIVFYLALEGIPPPSAVMVPVLLIPITILMLGLVWILSAVGVYVRDLRQIAGVITPALMFTSPIFFPLSAVPPSLRDLLYANPLTFIVVSARNALFFGTWPSLIGLAGYSAAACIFAVLGYLLFMRLRDGFADVV
jgi:homopolymeric O-antigen transport system permease protein